MHGSGVVSCEAFHSIKYGEGNADLVSLLLHAHAQCDAEYALSFVDLAEHLQRGHSSVREWVFRR